MRGSIYQILHLIIQRKILGRRSIENRGMSWLRNLREWFNMFSANLFRAAVFKIRIAMMLAILEKLHEEEE